MASGEPKVIKKTSIKVDAELWRTAKHAAIDRGLELSDLVEIGLKRELRLEKPLWEESPGSRRCTHVDNGFITVRVVEIDPLNNTIGGRKDYDAEGRRPHENEWMQIVMVLEGEVRYKDEKNGNGVVHKAGDVYVSVKPPKPGETRGEGYWHTHYNDSETIPAKILVIILHEPPSLPDARKA